MTIKHSHKIQTNPVVLPASLDCLYVRNAKRRIFLRLFLRWILQIRNSHPSGIVCYTVLKPSSNLIRHALHIDKTYTHFHWVLSVFSQYHKRWIPNVSSEIRIEPHSVSYLKIRTLPINTLTEANVWSSLFDLQQSSHQPRPSPSPPPPPQNQGPEGSQTNIPLVQYSFTSPPHRSHKGITPWPGTC